MSLAALNSSTPPVSIAIRNLTVDGRLQHGPGLTIGACLRYRICLLLSPHSSGSDSIIIMSIVQEALHHRNRQCAAAAPWAHQHQRLAGPEHPWLRHRDLQEGSGRGVRAAAQRDACERSARLPAAARARYSLMRPDRCLQPGAHGRRYRPSQCGDRIDGWSELRGLSLCLSLSLSLSVSVSLQLCNSATLSLSLGLRGPR